MRAFCINLCLLAVVVAVSALNTDHGKNGHELRNGGNGGHLLNDHDKNKLHNGGNGGHLLNDHNSHLMNDDAGLPNPGLHDEHGESHGKKRRSPQLPIPEGAPSTPGRKRRSPQEPKAPTIPSMARKRRSNDENNHNFNEDENKDHSS